MNTKSESSALDEGCSVQRSSSFILFRRPLPRGDSMLAQGTEHKRVGSQSAA